MRQSFRNDRRWRGGGEDTVKGLTPASRPLAFGAPPPPALPPPLPLLYPSSVPLPSSLPFPPPSPAPPLLPPSRFVRLAKSGLQKVPRCLPPHRQSGMCHVSLPSTAPPPSGIFFQRGPEEREGKGRRRRGERMAHSHFSLPRSARWPSGRPRSPPLPSLPLPYPPPRPPTNWPPSPPPSLLFTLPRPPLLVLFTSRRAAFRKCPGLGLGAYSLFCI